MGEAFMIDAISGSDEPTWLKEIDAGSMPDPLPLGMLLRNSLYYPASGTDGLPIQCLGSKIFSYVYADYAISRRDLLAQVHERGFRGYDMKAEWDVSELIADKLRPAAATSDDGDPQKYRNSFVEPYAEWLIFERKPDYPERHGPRRFSLLFLGADGAAAYEALYKANGLSPKALAIIRPGTGFGLNWTDFENPNGILARTVLNNNCSPPEFLLCWGEAPCWPSYQECLGFFGDSNIGVWRAR